MLDKIRKMDRNEALEMVLEQKDIDEKTKNLLQGILYKIEVSYSDYKKAKVINKTEKQYIDEIIGNINKTVKPSALAGRFEQRECVPVSDCSCRIGLHHCSTSGFVDGVICGAAVLACTAINLII